MSKRNYRSRGYSQPRVVVQNPDLPRPQTGTGPTIAGDGMTAKQREKLRAVLRYPNPSFILYPSEYAPKPILGVPFDDINDPARAVPDNRVVVQHTSRSSGDDSTDAADDRRVGRTVIAGLLGDPSGVEDPTGIRRSELRRMIFLNDLFARERRMR